MAKAKGQVSVRGRFVNGVVGLYPGGDFFSPGAKVIKRAKVNREGVVTFTDLEPGARFFAAQQVDGEWRTAAVTAKEPAAAKQALSEEEISQRLAATRAPENVGAGVVTGPRGTVNANPTAAERAEAQIKASAIPAAHEPTAAADRPEEPHPRVKQADVPAGTAQRSDTPMGEGHPVEADEPQPRVPQSAVKAGTPQRSDTPLGEATPVEPDETQPGQRQEDVAARTRQRSDTPTGQAEPLPDVGPVRQARRRSSSRSKAKGATKAQAARARPKSAKKPAAKKPRRRAPARKSARKR